MSMWSIIISKLKEVLKSMIGSRTIEQTLHVAPAISSQMETAIETWSAMYKDQSPWLHEPTTENPTRIVSLGLPALIASEKARIALLELESEITAPTKEVEKENPNYRPPEEDEFGNIIPSMEPQMIKETVTVGNAERAEYLESQYKKLKKQLRKQIEYGIAKGGLVIKPYIVMCTPEQDSDITPTAQIEFDFIQADAFYPLAFDASGRITEAAFIQTKTEKDTIYRRLEYHKWSNNTVTVVNKAFKADSNTNNGDMTGLDLGHEVPLTAVPEWKELQDKAVIKNVSQPLFSYFKMPEANTVDTSSPLGVSGFSRAVNLIKDADMQYSRLLWEYEGGEMAIDIDRDALNQVDGLDGVPHTVPNHLQARLYRRVDLGEADTYQPFAPALRDASYIDGLNSILMRIEDTCGISRGTLSDSADIARTATELKILKQRSYQTNADIQQAIEDAVRDTIYVMNVYATLYEVTPEGEYEVNFEWDDSIMVDINEEINKRLTLMQNGLTSKLETRMWYFGETEQQAMEALIKVDEENVRNVENSMAMDYNRYNMRNRSRGTTNDQYYNS